MKEFIRDMLKAGRSKKEIAVLTLAKFRFYNDKDMASKIDLIIEEVEKENQ